MEGQTLKKIVLNKQLMSGYLARNVHIVLNSQKTHNLFSFLVIPVCIVAEPPLLKALTIATNQNILKQKYFNSIYF